MARRIAYAGEKFTIAFAREKNGACPGSDFFDALTNPLDKVKLMALFQIAGDHAKFYNPQKFGDLGGGLYELKSFQIRMRLRMQIKTAERIFITHGFITTKDKTPPEDIARAWRIFEEYQARTEFW